jgi:serine/threonine protein kinase
MSESSSFLPTTATLMPLPEASDALAPGTRIGEFEILDVVGAGGFGIVYRAWEPALEREVALKEYMPMGLVSRGPDACVALRSRAHEEDFRLGLRSFVNEARLLARFDHPALVKVHRFWESNGTAYMAMPFYKAQTLRQRRQELGSQPPTQAWLMSMIEPLLGALAEMHRADVYHRDIAPDNILWCIDNRPVLLDFGAARHVLADRTQSLTAILKPQFAPIEQYADSQSMRQGPWTDVFALASTCYFMLTGRPPLPATARILSDDLAPLAQLAPPGFSAHVLATLDWAMAVRPEDRPPSVAVLWEALHGHVPVPERPMPVPAPSERPPSAAAFENTIQVAPRLRRAAGPGAAVRDAVKGLDRRWLALAGLALAAGGVAWWSPGSAPSDAIQAAGVSASAPVQLASASTAMASELPAAVALATASGAARARGPSSATSSRLPGPRETCLAGKSGNVDECVRHACRTEPRFRKTESCLRLQRQAAPWWKIFKPG